MVRRSQSTFSDISSYNIMGTLSLPSLSESSLPEQHAALAHSLQEDLETLRNRDLRGPELNRPFRSLDVAYDQFREEELDSWEDVDQRPRNRDTLVRASGSLDASLAHHLLQPSYTTLFPYDGADTADPSNGCIAMVMGNVYNQETLLFDHIHRRSEDSEGLETLPTRVLDCHEKYTNGICDSMLAKVELMYGSKLRNRVMKNEKKAYKFTTLPLWGPFEGVTLFLAHESNYGNADLRYKFRRICLFALHPQRLFYESKHSAIALLQDRIHVAAAKMADMPVKEFYFRKKEWIGLVPNPFQTLITTELVSILNVLHCSGSEPNVLQETEYKHKAETDDQQVDLAFQKLGHPTKTSKRRWSVREDLVASGVLNGSISSGVEGKSKKRRRVPRKNPRQARNYAARTRALLYAQVRTSLASPAVGPSCSASLPIVPNEFDAEQLQTADNIFQFNTNINNATRRELSEQAHGAVVTSGSDDEPCIPASQESNDRYIRQGNGFNFLQKEVVMITGGQTSWTESNLETQTETTSNFINVESHCPQQSMTSPAFLKVGDGDKIDVLQEFKNQLSRSKKQIREDYLIRDLNLVNVDDMDSATRHDRLRTLKEIINRGDQLTDVEKAQLAELKTKGSRVHGRDLSKLDVASMDSIARKSRRATLRKKIDRHEVLDEAEMKQLRDFDMFYYTRG